MPIYNYSTYFLGCRKHLDTLKYNYFIHLKKEEKKEESPVFEITNELAARYLIPFSGLINQETFLNLFGEKSEFPAEIKAKILFQGKFV